MDKLPNSRKAQIYRDEYKKWKTVALEKFGYFPVFQPFKENFLLRNLSGNAIKLYLYLGLSAGNFTGETWVSIDTIAQYFGKSKRTISAWIKELEEAKLIKRMQLNPNDVAHTFLRPYGWSRLLDYNSLQKGNKDNDNE